MSVHVDEVRIRVIPAPPSGRPTTDAGEPKPGMAEELWATTYALRRREGRRTASSDFDD